MQFKERVRHVPALVVRRPPEKQRLARVSSGKRAAFAGNDERALFFSRERDLRFVFSRSFAYLPQRSRIFSRSVFKRLESVVLGDTYRRLKEARRVLMSRVFQSEHSEKFLRTRTPSNPYSSLYPASLG